MSRPDDLDEQPQGPRQATPKGRSGFQICEHDFSADGVHYGRPPEPYAEVWLDINGERFGPLATLHSFDYADKAKLIEFINRWTERANGLGLPCGLDYFVAYNVKEELREALETEGVW